MPIINLKKGRKIEKHTFSVLKVAFSFRRSTSWIGPRHIKNIIFFLKHTIWNSINVVHLGTR
ncbi:hypothetical protein NC653_037537 [Populus alba x Populus x berolinensis]|uniref:Uncharacterized protein n=1 Tax=Populus alba x Populus x berolinensis TaxID=444605 RepID=A0AAD6LEJ9_9ROSI|nr:hypothetical protein NC653_037537 [Populus alba x Populus x berolinensis]